MKITVTATAIDAVKTITVLENVTLENIVIVVESFFKSIGIHFAEELAPARANRLLNRETVHMFDHAKLTDYKLHLGSN